MSMIFTTEGRDHYNDVVLHGAAQVPTWYIALYEGDYEPQGDETAANIGARATEITAYTASTRPEFVESASANGSTSNSGSVATVVMSAAKTITAFGLISSAGKGAATGVLLSFQRLSANRTYAAGDTVKIPVSISLMNAG